MKTQILAAVVLLAIANTVSAQEVSATDLSRYELFEEGETIITLTELQDMEDVYIALGSGPIDFLLGKCFTVRKTSGEHV